MRKLLLCMLILFCTLLCGCLSKNSESLSLGKYELKDATGVTTLYVLLKENNEFIFKSSYFGSFLDHGTYEIKNHTLILTTDDKAYAYVFQIYNGNVLYFDLKQSLMITKCRNICSIKDGANSVNVRSGPSASYASYGYLNLNESFWSRMLEDDFGTFRYGQCPTETSISQSYGYAVWDYVSSSYLSYVG